MLYQLNQLQIPPQFFLISTWVLPTPAPVASTSLAAPPLPTTTHMPNRWHHGSKRVPRTLSSKCHTSVSFLVPPATMPGHVMPSFPHTLIGLGPFADQGYKIVFNKTSVTVYHPDGHPIIKCWRDLGSPHLWQLHYHAQERQRNIVHEKVKRGKMKI
jgi:hypothetical protein